VIEVKYSSFRESDPTVKRVQSRGNLRGGWRHPGAHSGTKNAVCGYFTLGGQTIHWILT